MKAILMLAVLLLLPAVAYSQKTCTRISATSQNCLVTVSWTASVVDATHDAPTQYALRRKDGAGQITEIGTVAATITTYQNTFSDSGNIAHCYDAIARIVSSDGTKTDSPPSTQACWTSPVIATTPPSTPSGFTISAIDSSTLRLSWDDAATEDSYEIWGRPAKGKGRQFAKVGSAPQDTTVWDWTKLKSYDSYCAHIRAVNGAGPSTYTPISCATTNR